MAAKNFHDKPYDAGTLAKLRIFELYAQEWIPVFLSQAEPKFEEVHIFDFFSGPGTDSLGIYGSPLRMLNQFRRYQRDGLAGWGKVRIVAHLFDSDRRKIDRLASILQEEEWKIPGVQIDLKLLAFSDALNAQQAVLANPRFAKLLIIDQCGVDEVSDEIFKRLVSLPTTDFIFFLSSSTLHRFHDNPAIKQKIQKPEDSYDVHREAFEYYRKLVPIGDQVFLGRFSIKKRSNIYGLIFGSRHPLGIHKFLQVAWANDEIAGEANFDIERENIAPNELVLPLDVMRPNKIREFEAELEEALRAGNMQSEADVIRFCIEAGMTGQHSAPLLKKLKSEGVIEMNFHVPDVRKFKSPRPIRMTP
jgi:three-Cys-motif partner protein